jgi:multidrug resistance efflux pump
MLTSKINYRDHQHGYVRPRYRVIFNIEVYEWTSLEDCLKELAEAKAVRKTEKKKRTAMNRAVKREERKLAEAKKRLALAKLALLRGRR